MKKANKNENNTSKVANFLTCIQDSLILQTFLVNIFSKRDRYLDKMLMNSPKQVNCCWEKNDISKVFISKDYINTF